ncbi:MAG TPA: glycosyltransferase [Candidatus Limnocylindrales bacterium]
MILVTLGTHPAPMDRLVRAIDALSADGVIEEPVIVQSAVYGYLPRHCRTARVVPADVLSAWIDEASRVVCHGGPGSILEVLSRGKVPRVVPRNPAFGEHVDDHQQRFVRWFAERRPLIPVWDLGGLVEALAVIDGPLLASLPRQTSVVAERLVEIVESSRPANR